MIITQCGLTAAEDDAVWLYRLAGESPLNPPGPAALAEALLGKGGLQVVPAKCLVGDSLLSPVPQRSVHGILNGRAGSYTLRVRDGLSPARAGFVIGYELAWWQQQTFRGNPVRSPEGLEQHLQLVAGAIVAPRQAMLRVFEKLTGRPPRQALPAVAKAFATSQMCAALRIGEVTGHPVAIVTPNGVMVRGHEFDWPAENEFHRLVKQQNAGVSRVRLTDMRAGVALFANVA